MLLPEIKIILKIGNRNNRYLQMAERLANMPYLSQSVVEEMVVHPNIILTYLNHVKIIKFLTYLNSVI